MKCIDFDTNIQLKLSSDQEKHIKICPKCKEAWESHALDRLLINVPFEPEHEPEVDISGKPPTGSFITADFWKEVEDFSERSAILAKVETFLAGRFKGNPNVMQKFKHMASKISNNLAPVPTDFDQRFVSALGYFSDKQIEDLSEKDLVDKMKKYIDDASDSE